LAKFYYVESGCYKPTSSKEISPMRFGCAGK
jgi:hypothetical protein